MSSNHSLFLCYKNVTISIGPWYWPQSRSKPLNCTGHVVKRSTWPSPHMSDSVCIYSSSPCASVVGQIWFVCQSLSLNLRKLISPSVIANHFGRDWVYNIWCQFIHREGKKHKSLGQPACATRQWDTDSHLQLMKITRLIPLLCLLIVPCQRGFCRYKNIGYTLQQLMLLVQL